MKKIAIVFLAILLGLPTAFARKKVAVVLSGGGAKGAAHIGALKVIQEAGIPIDYVVGTSMGSIVGGLYSIGYTPEQLDSAISSQDWLFLFKDKVQYMKQTFSERQQDERYQLSVPFSIGKGTYIGGGFINGQNISNLFFELTGGYREPMDFNTFPIPFACVATNLVNGEAFVFHNGILSDAMRASMSIPAVFTPVKMDSMVLVDGGVVNNYPVNIARQMGADIVIGVDVQSSLLPGNELTNPKAVINQIIDLLNWNLYLKNKKETTLYIRPDVSGFSIASFSASDIRGLITNGEHAARDRWADLMALKEELGLSQDSILPARPPFTPVTEHITIRHIILNGIDVQDDKEWLLKQCGLKENSTLTMTELNNAMNKLSRSHVFSDVSYQLQDGSYYNLEISFTKKQENQLNFGLHFDTQDIGALLINGTAHFHGRIDSELSITGRFGKNLYARADYSIQPTIERNINFFYMFRYNDLDIYDFGHRYYNTVYTSHLGDIGYSDVYWNKLKMELGLRYEYYHFNSVLYKDNRETKELTPLSLFSYYLRLSLLSQNKMYFPTEGVRADLGVSIYTDNMIHYRGGGPFTAINGSVTMAFSPTDRFTILPSAYGRVLLGTDIPYPYQNTLGGYVFGRYLPQQLPFIGISHIEIVRNTMAVLGLQLRQRIGGKQYVSLLANYGVMVNNIGDLFHGSDIWGGGVGYAYDSFFGPLEAIFGLSTRTRELQFYVSLGYTF